MVKSFCSLLLILSLVCSQLPVGTVCAAGTTVTPEAFSVSAPAADETASSPSQAYCDEAPAAQPISQEAYAQADQVYAAIDAMESSPEYANASQTEKTEAAISLVLASDSYMEDSLERNGASFTWWTVGGICCIYDPQQQERSDLSSETGVDQIYNEPIARRGGQPAGNQVYMISPYLGYEENFTKYDLQELVNEIAVCIGDTDGYTLYSGQAASIQKVANAISNGAVVVIYTHGSTDSSHASDDPDRVTDITTSYLTLTTSDDITSEDFADGVKYGKDGIVYITGEAIANHMTKDSPGGILWMTACYGMATDTIASPLRARGVEVVYGYSDSVTFCYGTQCAKTFWANMAADKTVAESIAIAKQTWGNWDYSRQIMEYYSPGCNQGYKTIEAARKYFVAFPVIVSDEDPYPGQRTSDNYGAASLQTVRSTYKLGKHEDITPPTNLYAIMAEAQALLPGEKLPYAVTLEGTITRIASAYDTQDENITAVMSVPGYESAPIKLCDLAFYGAEFLSIDDNVTVTGSITCFQYAPGITELRFAPGFTLDSYCAALPPVEPSQPAAEMHILSFDNQANRTEFSDEKQVWQQDGITVTNEKGNSTHNLSNAVAPAVFRTGTRLTIEAKDMVEIELRCENLLSRMNLSTLVHGGFTDTGVVIEFDTPTDRFVIDEISCSEVEVDSIHVRTKSQSPQYKTPITALSMDISGIAQGSPVGNVSAIHDEKAQLVSISVKDVASGKAVTSGNFTEGNIYDVSFAFTPAEGFCFALNTYLQPDYCIQDWRITEDTLCFTVRLDLRIPVTRVDLNLQGVKADQKVAAATVTPQSDGYTVADYRWYEKGNPTVSIDRFQPGCEYTLRLRLEPASAYRLYHRDVTANMPISTYSWIPDETGEYSLYLNILPLPVVAKLSAPQIETAEAAKENLSWGESVGATGYEIYRATSKSGKYTKVATVTDTTWQDSVTAGKTYYYKVKAVYSADSSKNSGYSGYVSIAYKCDEPVITVVNGSSGKPVISWEKISGAKKYTVYRATAVDGKYTKLDTTTKLTYTDSKATAGTTYFYKVIANASSSKYNSGYSNIVSCGVICGTPSVTVKIDAATGKPSLSWAKVEGAANYRILRQLPGEETFTELKIQTGITFADTTAPIDTVCQYQVQALGATEELNGAVSKTVTATSGIARPAMKATVDAVSGKPTLTWEAVEGAVKYEIYRSTKSTKGYTLLATVETTSYADESVAAGKPYYYKMVAIGEVSKSAETAYVKLTGKCAVPTITVENGPTGKPVISWEKVAGASKYTVYRATSENGKYTSAGTSKTQSFTDTKAKAGTTYFYKVIANASSSKYNSGYSNIVSCGVICGTPSVTVKIDAATGKPSLSWAKVEGAANYRILRQLPGEETFTELKIQTGITFADTTAPIDTVCQYQVQALGATEELNGAVSKTVTATSGIARPAMKATVDAVSGKPTLTWEPVEGAVKYEIYRSTKSTKGYTLLATVETTSYADESVAAGKTYYYKMVAIGEVSKSAETAYVQLTGKCAAPQSHVQIDEATGKPMVSWEKVNGAKQYTVYRSTDKFSGFKKLGTTKTLSYIDTKAEVGKTYFYTVVANASSSKYSSGQSYPMGATAICATPAVKVTMGASGKPMLSWNKVTGAVRYEIYLLGGEDYVTLGTVTGTSFEDVSCAPGEGRYYGVRAISAVEYCDSQVSEPVFATGACAAPKITGKNAPNGKPQLTWEAVEGATGYAIYRSTSKSKNYKVIDTTQSLSCTDISAVKGKTYYYKVVAVADDNAESADSNVVKVKCVASSRKTSSSTCKDNGKSTIWDAQNYEANRFDFGSYETKDPNRTAYLESLSPANGLLYYFEVDTMQMTATRTYGMPLVSSRENVEATVWSSSDPTVAEVNQLGFVTPLKAGNVVITATLTDPETQGQTIRTCYVTVVTYLKSTYAELEAMAKVEAKAIADYVMAYPDLHTDLERIGLAAKIINEWYVAKNKGGSIYSIEGGEIVSVMIPGYNQPYGTLITHHSTCAGDVRALGMILEYMGFEWYHVNADKWEHQWCVVYDVDGQTAFADGSMYGICGYGERAEDGSNWMSFNRELFPLP